VCEGVVFSVIFYLLLFLVIRLYISIWLLSGNKMLLSWYACLITTYWLVTYPKAGSPSTVVTIYSRKIHFNIIFSSPSQSAKRSKDSVGRHKGKRPLGIPRRIWKDNIKINLKECECKGIDWIELAHDKVQWQDLVDMAINFWVPRKVRNLFASWETIRFLQANKLHGVSFEPDVFIQLRPL
jgi:hypothetical protein